MTRIIPTIRLFGSALFPGLSARIFWDFLTSCQNKRSQIHRLYDEKCSGVRMLCLRFLKKDVVMERLEDEISMGEPTGKELRKLDRDEELTGNERFL